MAQPRDYTPRHLAERILRSRGALEGERKQVTVLFVDVKDSMKLAARVDPEEWHKLLDRFFTLLADAVHRFEGTVNQYTGDGVMALFGAPLAHEDHAQRACHAALLACENVRRLAQEVRRAHGLRFAIRLGLNSGEVIVGAIGDDLRMDYTAQGNSVGLAARMQESAKPGRAYLTAETAALVRDYFDLERVGTLRLKGVPAPVRTFALLRARSVKTRLEAARARGLTRLVGRERELGFLDAAMARAAAGDGQVVGVVGAPGVGKSRLCQEAVERWRAEGLAIAEAHCPAHGRALPYGVLRELLRNLFELPPDASAAWARRAIRSRLRKMRAARDEDLALVLELLGLAETRRRGAAHDVDVRRDRLFELACGLVQSQSARERSVVAIDDVQWIDAESEAFLARLVDAVAWTRTLLLLNARPGEMPAWTRAPHFRRLDLAPLDAEASGALVRELVGSEATLAEVCAFVNARAEGNPFFAEELVHSLLEQGVLARERSGDLRLAGALADAKLPPTVQALLAARIDGLPGDAKHVLQVAGVIGKRFPERVLRLALAGEAEIDLDAALARLEQVELVRRESADELAFTHPLTQEVAYTVQLQDARSRRHEAVARALQTAHEGRLGQHAAWIAHHFAAAGKPYETREWRRRAALHVTNIQLKRPHEAR